MLKAAFMVPHPPLIVKEVGKGAEEQVSLTLESYQQIAREIADISPETIIISSPHTKLYNNYFHLMDSISLEGSFRSFGAAEVTFNELNDMELLGKIDEIAKRYDFPTGILNDNINELDHGTMVPLYFINKYLGDYKIIVIGISGLSYPEHYKMGKIIKEAIEELDRDVVYIASGDLSHVLQKDGPYGFLEEGPIYDKQIIDVMSKGDFGKLLEFDPHFVDKAAVCGHPSFLMMAGVLDGLDVKSKFYSHEDITGVGYGICSYYPIVENSDRLFLDKYLIKEEQRLINYYNNSDDYVLLAKNTIDNYIRNNQVIDIPDNIDKELLTKKAGVFVSIHKFNELRGCIGTIISTKDNIAEEIINNAISASTKDNRFDPITEDELKYLEINVDVLGEYEDVNSKDELDVKRYGVIVSQEYKRGLLLPDIEGVDSIDEQLEIACHKGGIDPKSEYKIQRFEVIRHKGNI